MKILQMFQQYSWTTGSGETLPLRKRFRCAMHYHIQGRRSSAHCTPYQHARSHTQKYETSNKIDKLSVYYYYQQGRGREGKRYLYRDFDAHTKWCRTGGEDEQERKNAALIGDSAATELVAIFTRTPYIFFNHILSYRTIRALENHS